MASLPLRVRILLTFGFLTVVSHSGAGQDVQKNFQVECVRPLGIRVIPEPEYRILQTGCRGADTNVPLAAPYDVSQECLIPTDSGTAVQVILEEAISSTNLVGGLLSRVFIVSCDYPGTEGYKDTFNRQVQGVKQPAGLDPTATSGVFKYTGVLMSIIDKAAFAARQWAEHLASSAFIGQELYLTISHRQKDEGQAYIIPRTCRVRPATGNFTTFWDHTSTKRHCFSVSGIAREPVRIFTDVTSSTDVMSIQFFGFQFLGHETEVMTFECDVLLCGDITAGSCGTEWTTLQNTKSCVTSQPPPLQRRRRSSGRAFSKRAATAMEGSSSTNNSNYNNNYGYSSNSHPITTYLSPVSARTLLQEETVRVEIRMLMPTARLHYAASGSSLLPSSLAALLLTGLIKMLQVG